MKIPFVDLKSQYQNIKLEIDAAIQNVIDESAFISGKYARKFEQEFADYCRAKYCVSVGNGTDALFLSLKALGIGSGDEVITAANSFIATSEAISACGGKVVFVDCHPDYYTIDVRKIEEKITPNTKAIIPVHLYGQPADMDAINEIAKKYNLFVIEDAAQAHGAVYLPCGISDKEKNFNYIVNNNPRDLPHKIAKSNNNLTTNKNSIPQGEGKRVGTFGDIACFSFYPGKNLGAYGDAGAIITNNKELAVKTKMLANHGRIDKYNHELEGYNSRMDGIQGAILSVKLKHIDRWNLSRRCIVNLYKKYLKNVSEIILPLEKDNVKSVYHLFVIRAKRRDELKIFLEKKGVSTGIHYPIALPNLNAYKYLNYSADDFPVSSRYQDEILSIPIFPEMTEDQVKYVSDSIMQFYNL